MFRLPSALQIRTALAMDRRFQAPLAYTAPTRLSPGTEHGFTLVELLVTIGIIGILVAILMPVLGKARQQANAAACASNMRQIAIGWTMYAQANGGISCPARLPALPAGQSYDLGNGPQHRPRWYDVLGAMSNAHPVRNPSRVADDAERIDNAAFLCPQVPDWNNARNYVYGYNYQFLGNARERPDGRPVNFPVKVSRIKAAETVLAADSMGTAAGKSIASRTRYREDGGHDRFGVGNHGYTIDPPRLTELSDYCEDNYRTPADRSAPDPRHAGRANVAFCDGHVDRLTLPEVGYIVHDDGRVAVDGPGVHNRLFSGNGNDEDPPPVQ